MKFIITVDTEADNQWKTGNPISLKNIESLSRFQALCQKYDFTPTYLVTYEVAEDVFAADLLSGWQHNNLAEIGAHLHPWTNPPFVEYEKGQHAYPSSLRDEDFTSKLTLLTEKIEKNFGKRPTSYRAGRWGFKDSHAKILEDLGYIADCSVTPKVNWAAMPDKLSGMRGPDFENYAVSPYYIGSLLEVPMTILYTGFFNKEESLIVRKFSALSGSFLKKVFNKLFFQKKWLRIFPTSSDKDWEMIYRSAVKNNLPVLEFMIHSSELMVGGSPYAKTEQGLDFIYAQIECMFEYFKKHGVVGATLSDFAKNYDSGKN